MLFLKTIVFLKKKVISKKKYGISKHMEEHMVLLKIKYLKYSVK